jgi:RNA polymerase sigma-70 factor (ECF subfamily)
MVFETGLPTRHYFDRSAVNLTHLVPSDVLIDGVAQRRPRTHFSKWCLASSGNTQLFETPSAIENMTTPAAAVARGPVWLHGSAHCDSVNVAHFGRLPRLRARGADTDVWLLERLRQGDEQAFVSLVSRHHDPMLRFARNFVHSQAVAEEVVQETWIGVLRGIDRFEGRSSLRTWLLAILANRAQTAGAREARMIPVSDTDDLTPALEGARSGASAAPNTPDEQWIEDVEDRISAAGLRAQILAALAQMPSRQRAVVMLRDVAGMRSDEVCVVLGLTAANERVLLHRGRTRLRRALEATIAGSAM